MKVRRWIIALLVLFAGLYVATAGASQALTGQRVSFPRDQQYDVYSGPGTGYFRGGNGKASVSTNDGIEVYGMDQGWALIRYGLSNGGERFGYIDGSYIPSDVSIVELNFDRLEAYIAEDSELTDDPISSLRTIKTIDAGTKVLELAHMGEWTYLECDNIRGFVRSMYVAYPNDEGIGVAFTSKDGVNVREKMDKNSKKVATIKKGYTKVTANFVGKGADGYTWYNVTTSNGKTGYIRRDFLIPSWYVFQNASVDVPLEPGVLVLQNDTEGMTASDIQNYKSYASWILPVYGDSIEDAYKKVLIKYERGIEAYEQFQKKEIQYLIEYDSLGINPLYTALLDVTGDWRPELLFMCAYEGAYGYDWYGESADLYIFTWNGEAAECILYVENVYSMGGNYPWYTISQVSGTTDLYLQYGNNGPGTTEKYILNENGIYSRWMMADALFTGGGDPDLGEEEYEYKVNDNRVHQKEYDEAMAMLKVDSLNVIASAESSDGMAVILTVQEMINRLNTQQVSDNVQAEQSVDEVEEITDIRINEASFPDNAFRRIVSEQADTDHDGWLNPAEIEEVTVIDFWYESDIVSLQGIEYFSELQVLEGGQTSLSELNLSRNKKLKSVNCPNNGLSSLILGELPDLTELDCSNNALLQMDASGCPNLQTLRCGGNILSNLDVSKNTKLFSLACQFNYLYELDVTMLPGLQELHCFSNQISKLMLRNPLLNQIDCEHNQFTTLDISECTALVQMAKGSERVTDNLGVDSLGSENGYFTLDSTVALIYGEENTRSEIAPVNDAAVTEQKTTQTATTNAKNVNVRAEASKNSKKIVTLSKKETSVTVLERETGNDGYGWYYIETEKGKKGYIREDFLTIKEETSTANFQSVSPTTQDKWLEIGKVEETEGDSGAGTETYEEKYAQFIQQNIRAEFWDSEMVDIDQDGIPELIIYISEGKGELWFYTIDGGEVVPLRFFRANEVFSESGMNNVAEHSDQVLIPKEGAGLLIGGNVGIGCWLYYDLTKQGNYLVEGQSIEIAYGEAEKPYIYLSGESETSEISDAKAFLSKYDITEERSEILYDFMENE